MPKWEVQWHQSVLANTAVEAAMAALDALRSGSPEARTLQVRLDQKHAHLINVTVPELEPESRPEPDETGAELAVDVINAAAAHAAESEPDMEVGDLQSALLVTWQMLTPEQRRKAYTAIVKSGLGD